jgi:diphosphomevalonate decarboxylase
MTEQTYLKEAHQIQSGSLPSIPRSIIWEAPANIALIKYWGKKGEQLPISPSLSMTLNNSITRTELHYRKSENAGEKIEFRFNAEKNSAFETRVKKFIDRISSFFPFLDNLDLFIHTNNTFPHSAGIASSASAMSSMALCICSLEEQLKGEPRDSEAFFRKASYMARLGSGSASRSVYGDYVEWGAHNGGSDEYATPLGSEVHENMKLLYDSILITSSSPKKISSSRGHSLMNGHPYQGDRIKQAGTNLYKLKEALKTGDFAKFTEIVENEALSLHALMLSSNPGYVLLNEASLKIIERIRAFRERNNARVAFTLDAGPNIHLLYTEEEQQRIQHFINNDLSELCESGRILNDFTGNGPERIDKK